MAVAPQLRALLHAVNALLRKRRYHAALAMLKGFRNGAVYGAKIRAPHALVMTFLFRSGSLQEKLRAILQATYTHSRNLACFVFTYKGLCALQAHVQGETYQVHSFLAAFIGGLLVFGGNSNINSQVKRRLDLETDHQYLAESSGPARGRGRHPGKGTHRAGAGAGPLTGPKLGVRTDKHACKVSSGLAGLDLSQASGGPEGQLEWPPGMASPGPGGWGVPQPEEECRVVGRQQPQALPVGFAKGKEPSAHPTPIFLPCSARKASLPGCGVVLREPPPLDPQV
uniref:Peroxisomal membrane protein 4 n=1 Tax=Ailuropoda melanoleuca TaxID=9646 RepID=A0A7N5JN56_AILME